MAQDLRFSPAFIPDASLTPDLFEQVRHICDDAPATHGGRHPVLAVSRQVLISEDGTVLPLEGIAVHRNLHGPIAGTVNYDEMPLEEQDHFEPLFRIFWRFSLLRNRPARRRAPASPTEHLIVDNRGIRFACVYFRSFCAVFPASFSGRAAELLEKAGDSGAWRYTRTGPQAARCNLCSVILPVPASNHAAIELGSAVAHDWSSLRMVVNAYSNYDTGDPELDSFCHEDFRRSQS